MAPALSEAVAYTRKLATSHYENFHVVTFLLPKRLHQDFYNVYAFCRWADDLADETGDRHESLRLLAEWRDELQAMYRGEPNHPIFVALEGTVHKHNLPIELFDDLISAFEQDQTVTRYHNWPEVFDYCRRSANPVGRLVLRLCGYADAERDRLSDATCTALQLANFWQDIAVDLKKDRLYLPLDLLEERGYTLADWQALRYTPQFRDVMREAVDMARALFLKGLPLVKMVDRRLSFDLDLFSRGGLCILDKIEQQDYNVLAKRPSISKSERVLLLFSVVARTVLPSAVSKFSAADGKTVRATQESYAYCRKIARARARNFYYSFILLSADQKNAMCAIYAFMRFCDDLSDESGASLAAIDTWRSELDRALAGNPGDHPVWPAFCDAVERYRIPHEYFHEMIAGVSSDLEPRRMETFDQLYRYCYQVASVVGLTTIHIFGFDSPEALPLAEKCGIAFQLTNILRDVREDADNGRTYIPAEDLRRFDADLRTHDERFVRLMRFEAQRARQYYDASRPLIDLVHRRSRPSLWALIQIYRRLLERIERSNYDVLTRRISLPTWEKLSIVARAAVM